MHQEKSACFSFRSTPTSFGPFLPFYLTNMWSHPAPRQVIPSRLAHGKHRQEKIREISGGKSGTYPMANLDLRPMFGGKNEKQ
jgi:hypothetical protein